MLPVGAGDTMFDGQRGTWLMREYPGLTRVSGPVFYACLACFEYRVEPFGAAREYRERPTGTLLGVRDPGKRYAIHPTLLQHDQAPS